MKQYYRIMLGQKSAYAKEARDGGYIGAGWLGDIDLTDRTPQNWREFNKEYIPLYQERHPDKTKISAGLACGMLHTIVKGINEGDVVISPDGDGSYYIGEVSGEYQYKPGSNLPHQRPVKWYPGTISRDELSEGLKNSAGSIGTVSNITKYGEELEALVAGTRPTTITTADESVEDPSVFALEEHLEEFLVYNWNKTELGKTHKVYSEEGDIVGQQYPTDTGPIDILAVSNDGSELLVVELKRGRASDVVVGQLQRYMGYVKEELAESDQHVRGAIIAFDDDPKIHRALSVTNNIDLYTYNIQFTLNEVRKS